VGDGERRWKGWGGYGDGGREPRGLGEMGGGGNLETSRRGGGVDGGVGGTAYAPCRTVCKLAEGVGAGWNPLAETSF